jgi:hypothetical protein
MVVCNAAVSPRTVPPGPGMRRALIRALRARDFRSSDGSLGRVRSNIWWSICPLLNFSNPEVPDNSIFQQALTRGVRMLPGSTLPGRAGRGLKLHSLGRAGPRTAVAVHVDEAAACTQLARDESRMREALGLAKARHVPLQALSTLGRPAEMTPGGRIGRRGASRCFSRVSRRDSCQSKQPE